MSLIKKITILLCLFLLPVILCFMMKIQFDQINKPLDDFELSEGIVESHGMTTKINKGSSRSPSTEQEVFYIKLESEKTIFTYFSWQNDKITRLSNKVKKGQSVKIFNQGYNENQNTVGIIQLESDGDIFISKSEFVTKSYFMFSFFLLLFVLYFFVPYKLMYLNSKPRNPKRKNKKVKRLMSFLTIFVSSKRN
jgi:hypothetical protein